MAEKGNMREKANKQELRKTKIINVYRGFTEFGGAETVLLNIHGSLKKEGYTSFVSGPNLFSENHPKYNIQEQEYIQLSLKNISKFNNATVISHHRKTTTFLYWVKRLPGVKFRLIHVSHNEFFDLQKFTFLPKEIISVSERVKKNLIAEFNVKPEHVRVIYNGLEDANPNPEVSSSAESGTDQKKINILYPGRITKVKRQVEVFEQLKDKLAPHLQIDFAGVGEELEELQNRTGNDKQFNSLGFVSLKETLPKYDYVLLFSTNEGLPLTLIEGCMFGKPLICNDIGGNWEILENGHNGFAANSFEDLVKVLNNLPMPGDSFYNKLSQHSRRTYEEKFRKERMIKEYLDVISHHK